MTGRELIIYILENGLEDKPVIENGKFIGFMSLGEVAVKFDVGTAAVKCWIANRYIDSIEINGEIYISPKSVDDFAKRLAAR